MPLDRTPKALVCRDIVIEFDGQRVLDHLSFAAVAGVVTQLRGSNGSGKTTILNAIAGFVRPNSGRILAYGIDKTNRCHEARDIQFAIQGKGTLSSLSVLEHLQLARSAWHCPASRQWCQDLIDSWFPELSSIIGVRAGKLSGGQCQMIKLLCAVSVPASILLFDEPSISLSEPTFERFANDLVNLTRLRGVITIVAEHRLSNAAAHMETFVIERGRANKLCAD